MVKVEIKADCKIDGDFTGNIRVAGNNVKIIVEGDLTGNVDGKCSLEVKGDFIGTKS